MLQQWHSLEFATVRFFLFRMPNVLRRVLNKSEIRYKIYASSKKGVCTHIMRLVCTRYCYEQYQL